MRRILIEKLIKESKKHETKSKKQIKTIDPIIRLARRIFPFYSESELYSLSVCALRIILEGYKINYTQTTLINIKN
jgi:hypothetical protein